MWNLVDHDFHDLGTMHYDFQIDADFAHAWRDTAEQRGLTARTVNYHGFPIDVGSVVSLSLLNPNNRIPAVIVSSNVYANRAETTVLAKSCIDAAKAAGKKVAVVAAMSLSNRMFTRRIEPEDDRIHSLKDDEWNRKILQFLGDGRLEDVGQLSRTIHNQIRVQKVVAFKPMWFLSAMNDHRNDLTGEVLAYEAFTAPEAPWFTSTQPPTARATKNTTRKTSRCSVATETCSTRKPTSPRRRPSRQHLRPSPAAARRCGILSRARTPSTPTRLQTGWRVSARSPRR